MKWEPSHIDSKRIEEGWKQGMFKKGITNNDGFGDVCTVYGKTKEDAQLIAEQLCQLVNSAGLAKQEEKEKVLDIQMVTDWFNGEEWIQDDEFVQSKAEEIAKLICDAVVESGLWEIHEMEWQYTKGQKDYVATINEYLAFHFFEEEEADKILKRVNKRMCEQEAEKINKQQ